jgi:hypothetical protein
MWRIDPLLARDLKANNGMAAVAVQRRSTHASTTIELLLETVLCNPLLGSCNSWTITLEMGMFSVWSLPSSYLEDNWGATQLANIKIGMICFAMPVLTEDLYIVQKETFSITCYMCDTHS